MHEKSPPVICFKVFMTHRYFLEMSVLRGNLLILLKATVDFQMSRVIGYKTGVQFQSGNENDGVALQ